MFKNLKSSNPDFRLFETIEFRLDSMNKNILYVTHQVDKLVRMITVLKMDKNLEYQAQQYYGKEETSHQTDLDEQ